MSTPSSHGSGRPGPAGSTTLLQDDDRALPDGSPNRGGLWWLGLAAALVTAGWVVIGYGVGPALVRSAYQGESLDLFNRVITGQAERPVSAYLSLWFRFAHAATLSIMVLWGVGLAAVRLAPRVRRRLDRPWRRLAALPRDPGTLMTIALWFGLVAGLGEGLLLWGFQELDLLAWDMRLLTVTSRIVGVSLVVMVAVFVTLGLGALATRPLRRFPSTGALVFVLAFVTAYNWLAVPLTGRLYEYALILIALGAAFVLTRQFARHSAIAVRWSRTSLLALLPLSLLVVVAVNGGDRLRERTLAAGLEPPGTNRANVIIMVIDAVRADHLSTYGYARPTSPHIDRLARTGVLFENAFAPSSWSPPSHATLLTGRLPHEHRTEWCRGLDEEFPTLAEVLLQHGYRTGGFSANTMFFTSGQGFDRGFLRFEDSFYSHRDMLSRTMLGRRIDRVLAAMVDLPVLNHLGLETLADSKRADDVNRSLLSWIDQDSTAPFLAVLNYFDAHGPEVPPVSHRNHFGQGPDPFPRLKRVPWRWPRSGTEEQFQYVVDTYDEAIHYIDEQIGALVLELKQRGIADRTLLVLTSDHGELLREHGTSGHRTDLWETLLHVPLILHWPEGLPSGLRIEAPAEALRTLPATIVELLGLGRHPFPGPSLEVYWTDPVALDSTTFPIAQLAKYPLRKDSPPDRGWVESLITPDWHYIVHEHRGARLFDRRWDPEERYNLADTPRGRAVVAELEGVLRRRVPREAMRDVCWSE